MEGLRGKSLLTPNLWFLTRAWKQSFTVESGRAHPHWGLLDSRLSAGWREADHPCFSQTFWGGFACGVSLLLKAGWRREVAGPSLSITQMKRW